MKHIFYVHSYVTYLVTLGVVEHERIQDDDVLVISARNAVNQKRFKEIDFNSEFPTLIGVPCYGTRLFYLKNTKAIQSFDKAIGKFCDTDNFACYLPSNKHFVQQLLMTHKKCVSINYIEEGLFTYNNEFRKNSWPYSGISGLLKRFINTGNRNLNPLNNSDNSSTLYTLFDPVYYNSDLEVKCTMPVIANLKYDGIVLKNSNVLMMNAFKDAPSAVIDRLLTLLEEFARNLFKNKESIYIKHHPYASDTLKKQIVNIFINTGVRCYVMDEKLNTELMLFNSHNLKIYGFFSAAMLYGAMMGHKSITFVHCFESQSKECREYIAKNFPIPDVFINHSVNYEYEKFNS